MEPTCVCVLHARDWYVGTDLTGLFDNVQDRQVHSIQVLRQLLLLLGACLKPGSEAWNLLGTVPAPLSALWSLHIQASPADGNQPACKVHRGCIQCACCCWQGRVHMRRMETMATPAFVMHASLCMMSLRRERCLQCRQLKMEAISQLLCKDNYEESENALHIVSSSPDNTTQVAKHFRVYHHRMGASASTLAHGNSAQGSTQPNPTARK